MNKLQMDIIKTLWEYGSLDRDALVNILNAPRTTIFDNLLELIKFDIIKKYTLPKPYQARPRVLLRIKDRKKCSDIAKMNMDHITDEFSRLIEQYSGFELCNLIDMLLDSNKVLQLKNRQE